MALKKELGFLDLFSIASGAMISSGIFILPALAFSKAGPSMIISYLLGGLIAFVGILGIIELTTAMPKAGGDYFFINRTLGPLIGTISGVLSWFAISLKTAFAIFGISGITARFLYGEEMISSDILIISIFVTIFFVVLNIVGVDLASKFEVLLVVVLISIIVIYIIMGIFKIDIQAFTPFIQKYKINMENEFVFEKAISIFSKEGMITIFSTTAFVFVSFGGLLKAASVSEEVKNPTKNVPLALVASIITITILYTLLLFVTVGVSKGRNLMMSITPIADVGRTIAGDFGFYIIIIASMLAFITTGNAGIMAASRYPLALSRDRLFPKFISKVHKKFKTPIYSIVITGMFIMGSLLLSLESLAKTASAVILLTYILTNVAVIIIRESDMANYQPSFRTPFYPIPQIFTIIIYSLFIGELGYKAVETSFAFVIFSIILYFLYGKKHAKKQYAFLHLLIKMTENLNVTHDLESELRDIIHERDDIELDEFDKLVKQAVIMDLKGPLTLDELFEVETESLKNILGIPKNILLKLFHEREKESSTAITNFTAIPHIVLNTEKEIFHLTIIRCKEGIIYNKEKNNIKSVFLFISSKKMKKTHLQTLASIASLVRDKDFKEKWINAKNADYIRDMVLLSKRKRNN
ncbi:amino acid/polyamine/organocation transporter (APC superfamily) [Hypnocyclicus thermotrophus]|uniref:Amino acid/polyamine/organocation transporter (APC superfamily) n=1 Tax=Hypnocyclicus thermotrophus TaxID=1627895 RepID=A0AA46I578_9FUSO|nr:amino acid permease [Hypnocyclicus thermotrophus]TDT68605.1 amino acid/polyamine/organocation transporter (APC superfamily) [Hypnocyclicus thermotrophus]